MIAYISIFSLLSLASVGIAGKRDQAMALGIVLVFLVWFMGSRYYVGCDFETYLLRFYRFATPDSFSDLLQRPEWGYEALVWLMQSMGLGFVWVNIVAAIAYATGFYVLFRSHPAPLFLLAVAFPVMMLQLGMSGTRQALAVAFLMLAYDSFRHGRSLATAALILVAMQFHTSAIIFLPLALIAGRKVSPVKLIASLVVMGPIVVFLLADRFEVYSDRYIEDRHGALESDGALIRYVLIFIPAVLLVRHRAELKFHFPRDYEMMKVIALATFAVLPVALINTTILHRLIYYLMPVSIITFVSVGYFVFGRGSASLGRIVPLVIYGGYMLSWLALSRHARVCFEPYQSYTLL